MTAEECAVAIQLYLDGAAVRDIGGEFRRHPTTIDRLVGRMGLRRGHEFRTRGPRDYLIDRVVIRHCHAEICLRNLR